MSTKNYSLYGLPEKVIFCKKCVVSNQRPNSTIEFKSIISDKKKGINFDENGICDACNYNEIKKKIDWKKRETLLFKILDKFRKNNGEYDCIVPSSGGKDSGFAAHILKNKYGMNPLAITWAPNMWTDIGFQNFNNLSRIGGIDSILYTPNGKLHRYLTKLAFLNLGHPFQPFIHGQKLVGPLFASKFNVPLVIYGENSAEYGNEIDENNFYEMNDDFYCINDNEQIDNIKISGTSINEIIKKSDFKIEDFSPYFPLKKSLVKEKNIQMLYLGYFEKWDPQESFYYSSENTGFRPAQERSECTYSKYTELDDMIIPFHWYTTFIKFGIGRTTHEASHEIRNDKISREEGVNLVSKFDNEFPNKNFKSFLEYLEIDEKIFLNKIDELRSSHLWEFKNRKWSLKQKCF